MWVVAELAERGADILWEFEDRAFLRLGKFVVGIFDFGATARIALEDEFDRWGNSTLWEGGSDPEEVLRAVKELGKG